MMKKIRMNCTATLDETFADFLLSRRAKGLAEKTLESYSSQWKAVARHLDTGTDIAALQKADLDAMIVSMRDAGLSPNSINCTKHAGLAFYRFRADRKGRGVCQSEREHRHHNPAGAFHADRVRRSGGIGAGEHFGASA